MQAVGGAGVEQVLAQLGVGGHAAAEGEALGADLGGRPAGLVHEHVDDGGLERRRDVGRVDVRVGSRTWFITDVLSPEKLKSRPSLRIARGKSIAVGSPSTATRSIAGPPG